VVGAGAEALLALRGIELGLEFGHSVAKLLGTAEELDDVGYGTVSGERRDVEDVRKNELRIAMLRVFLE
jgi:hypothetical protein